MYKRASSSNAVQGLMSTGSSRRDVANFDFFEDPMFSYQDRSMLRPTVIPGLPLRSNKFRPLTPFNADTSTYSVRCLKLVSPTEIEDVVTSQIIAKAKDAAYGRISLDEGAGVFLRRSGSAVIDIAA
jgi:hypothetical protein